MCKLKIYKRDKQGYYYMPETIKEVKIDGNKKS